MLDRLRPFISYQVESEEQARAKREELKDEHGNDIYEATSAMKNGAFSREHFRAVQDSYGEMFESMVSGRKREIVILNSFSVRLPDAS